MPTVQNLAKSIVNDSLRPKELESVVITTYPHTIDLAEQVALQCQKAGADPIVLLDTDGMFYGQFENFTEENLRTTSAHCLGLAEYAQSYVWLGGPQDPSGMAKVPRERWAAWSKGEEAHYDKWDEKKPKSVGVSLGLVTKERAKTYGFNYAKWKESVEAAIATDYRQMESFGRTVAGLLGSPVEAHLTAENGTDLTFRLAGSTRRAHVNDGVISDEDFAAGNRDASLPAGDVWIAPVEDSARGTFVADTPIPQMGKLIEGLAWTFARGKVTDFSAKKNVNLAQTTYDTSSGAKDMFGGLGVGINRKAQPGFLTNSIVAGAVTITIGDNRSLDGGNVSGYGFAGSVVRGTLEIAGKTVIRNGKWAI